MFVTRTGTGELRRTPLPGRRLPAPARLSLLQRGSRQKSACDPFANPDRQSDDREGRGPTATRREDRTARHIQIPDPVYPTLAVHHALVRGSTHPRCPHGMAAADESTAHGV